MQFPPFSRYLVPPKSKYSPQLHATNKITILKLRQGYYEYYKQRAR